MRRSTMTCAITTRTSRASSSSPATSATSVACARACTAVDVVFQAAALKHVYNCEEHPYEAVMTNIIGTQNVITAALDLGVERLVTVSTDKAVKPVNVMGMTKAIQERLVIAANRAVETIAAPWLLCPLRQRHELARIRDSVLPRARRPSASRSPSRTSGDDPLPADAQRRHRSRAVRRREHEGRRDVHQEGACGQDHGSGAGDRRSRPDAPFEPVDHRHAARREDARDPDHRGRTAARHRSWARITSCSRTG